MALIHTTRGERDESTLRKTEGSFEDDNERTTWVEYCDAACEGPAHQSRQPDKPGVFCAQHIHRSVAMTLKKNVVAEGVAAMFGT